jgi:hypothetical protein
MKSAVADSAGDVAATADVAPSAATAASAAANGTIVRLIDPDMANLLGLGTYPCKGLDAAARTKLPCTPEVRPP